jgi:hypothetical protein
VLGGDWMAGYVDKYMDAQTPNGWYVRTSDTRIKREYWTRNGYPYPQRYGFCLFDVPEFESPNQVPVCTLFYKQETHSGSLNLVFNWASKVYPSWPPDAESLWKGIDTSSYQLAPTQSVQPDGWCKLALSNAGASVIEGIGEAGGGPLITGWRYDNPTATWYTHVSGPVDAGEGYVDRLPVQTRLFRGEHDA